MALLTDQRCKRAGRLRGYSLGGTSFILLVSPLVAFTGRYEFYNSGHMFNAMTKPRLILFHSCFAKLPQDILLALSKYSVDHILGNVTAITIKT